MLAIVEAVPMVLQDPGERLIAASASRKSAWLIVPGLHRLGHLPERGARADPLAAEPAVEHRPAGDEDRRHVDARRAHEERGRGLVAAGQQHHAVERVGAQRLLDVHGAEVAVEHRGRAERALARREDRELERQPAGLVDAVPHPLGEVAQVGVAGGELRPGVADADHRAAVEEVGRQPWFFIQERW